MLALRCVRAILVVARSIARKGIGLDELSEPSMVLPSKPRSAIFSVEKCDTLKWVCRGKSSLVPASHWQAVKSIVRIGEGEMARLNRNPSIRRCTLDRWLAASPWWDDSVVNRAKGGELARLGPEVTRLYLHLSCTDSVEPHPTLHPPPPSSLPFSALEGSSVRTSLTLMSDARTHSRQFLDDHPCEPTTLSRQPC